jgi:hypothetical protein
VFCGSFVINDVEMWGGFGYDNVILYSEGSLCNVLALSAE